MAELWQRLLRRGPKYGVARSVAVFGPPGDKVVTDGLGPSAQFQAWAAGRGLAVTPVPDVLPAVEAHLNEWAGSTMGPALGNEVGLLLGAVMVENVPGASWVVWPNGHPVVRLATGRDVDVVAEVGLRLAGSGPGLVTLYERAASG